MIIIISCKTKKKKNGDVIELRCKNKVYNNTNFCEKHQNCDNFLKTFLNKEEEIITLVNGKIHILKVHIIVTLIF